MIAAVADEDTPLVLDVAPGQTHDARLFEPVLDAVVARGVEPDEVVGDKGFDADPLRDACHDHGIMPQIAARSNRPDAELATYPDAYRERNRVERFFAKLKQFRRVATRYDKLKVCYRGFLRLAGGFLRFRSRQQGNH